MGNTINQEASLKDRKVGDSKNIVFQFRRVTSAERESYRVGSYGYIL